MSQDCGNILMGPVTVWYGPAGSVEAAPDETSVNYGADWSGNWTEVGVTNEALTFGVTTETVNAMVEQRLMPVKTRRSSLEVAFETALAEITATNVSLGLPGSVSTTAAASAQKGYEQFDFEGNDFSIDERSWGFEGEYVDDDGVSQPARVYVRKGNGFMNGDLEWSRASEGVGMPLRVVALDDCSGSTPWHFQRVTAAATA